MIGGLLRAALAWTAASYVLDVPVRRAAAAQAARAHARRRGLPLLNVGAGTGRSALFGPTLYGDVNTDLCGAPAASLAEHLALARKGVVTYADAQDLSQFESGSFGAVLASHVLEHLPDPARALAEWLRVVGGDRNALFVVTPSWWAPHTWLHPGHAFYFTDAAGGTRGGISLRLRRPGETVAACKFVPR